MTVRLVRPTTTIWQWDVAVLRTLVEALPAGEAALLVDALPPLLAIAARPDDHADHGDQGSDQVELVELVRRVRRRTATYDLDDDAVREEIRAALGRVAGHCPAGLLYRLQLPLPDDVRALFPEPVRVHAVGTG
ncbi:DUF2267 domain-containing protein [Solwaraspora sp. WMMD791]|uniref:DUF2267 domain-containing protein n=1 Tax=Solwaraspora sp. WMMD791 TaxID=3016086 RepID=UPI00249B5C10|nr:DUF2267 domain-containing protein [Solwaraspora sp. WMMD791]WFE25326.1 DUF2267 domain-containing protein [Solwaraspora sp. WMMD791]